MKKKSEKKIKNKKLKKIAQAHTVFSIALFSLYVMLSSFYSPEFLFSDIRSKFSALADEFITITAKVLGPPIKPIVTLQSQCTSSNLSTIISWPSDENSTTFDIDRDGLPLITNLSSQIFQDNTALPGVPYAYVVTAHGQMSPFTAISDTAYITHNNCNNSTTYTVQIITIDSKNVINPNIPVTIFSQNPFFTGTSNIPNANIEISIQGSMAISGQTTANALGFWSWQTPAELTFGQREIIVRATDPNNLNNITQTHAFFVVLQKDAGNNKTDNDKNSSQEKKSINITPQPITTKPIMPSEIDFSLSITSNSIVENKAFSALILIDKLSNQYQNTSTKITYTIIDEKGEALYSVSENKSIILNASIVHEIFLPSYIKPGKYRLKVDLLGEKFSISKEKFFEVLPSPILNLGGGIILTYPQLLSNLGTISLWLLILLLLWLFLFSREYWLYLHAIQNVTEYSLTKLGLISLKKRSH